MAPDLGYGLPFSAIQLPPLSLKRLEKVITESAELIATGHIIIVEEARYRIRKLPI